jgi:hypothetical protein
MHFSTALATVAAIAPLVSAHGNGAPLPKIVGLNPRDLKARDLLSGLGARFTEVHEFSKEENVLKARQDDRECGQGVGSCAAGQCCSQAGCMLLLITIIIGKNCLANETKTAATMATTAILLGATTSMDPGAPTMPLLPEPTLHQLLGPRLEMFSTAARAFTTASHPVPLR